MKATIYQGDVLLKEINLNSDIIIIGRSNLCDIILLHEYISKQHARVTKLKEGFLIEDMGSKNGTYYKDKKITSLEVEASNLEIVLRPFRIVFLDEKEQTETVDVPPIGEEVALSDSEKHISLGVGKKLQPSIVKLTKKHEIAHPCKLHFGLLIGETEAMYRIYELIQKIATQDVPVLLLGETGTGKELIARAIHQLSGKKGQFIALNCASLDELLESELFGHLKGAFTGAYKDKRGKLAIARGGTLFLDEVGEMPHDVQVKLLRVMQDKTFCPLGSEREERTDARIIAATNQDITRLVQEGSIRLDFYHRIKVFDIFIPPLREKKKDIPLLVNYNISVLSEKIGLGYIPSISKEAMDVLVQHPWPGNVRQLENVLEKTLLLLEGQKEIDKGNLTIDKDDVMQEVRAPILKKQPASLEEAEKEALIRILRATGGDIKETARQLNVTIRTVYNYIKKHDIDLKEVLRSN